MADVHNTTFDTDDNIDDAADALLKRWGVTNDAAPKQPDQRKPSVAEEDGGEDEEEAPDDDTGEQADEGEDEGGEGEQDDKAPKPVAGDDHEVEVQVDGQTHKVAVKDLKRLFGQEASLTRKSQEVAEAHRKAEEVNQRHSTALNSLLERAKTRYEPFSKIDFMVAQQQLDPDEFAQLRQMAAAAKADVDFFTQELDGHVKSHRESYEKSVAEAAKSCIQYLTDPVTGIKDFGPDLYKEIREYAVSAGGRQDVIDNIVDPIAIKVLHKAMLYDRASAKGVTKIAKAPKNVNQTPKNGAAKPGSGVVRKAMDKLRASGDPDDAVEALVARWAAREE